MNDRFKFRAFYQGRFIYKSLTDANYYDKDNKCIGLANTLPNNLKWEQSTGLRDKNGKLIFEGDIIKSMVYTVNMKVVYCIEETFFGLKYSHNDDNRCSAAMPSSEEIEIIGNVHENPELLKAS